MAKKIISKLKGHHSVVLTCGGKSCANAFLDIYKEASKSSKGTCVVAISRPVSKILTSLEKKKIDYSKFLFIDCVDAVHQGVDKCQCIHVGSGESLTRIAMALKKVIATKKFDLIMIDNISSFLLYHSEVVIAKFLHDIISNLRKTKVKFIGVVLEKDLKGSLSELELFFDSVIKA
jgi:archaellum biogenesis ATPase FlaH